MKTLKFEVNRPGAAKWQIIGARMFLIPLFAYFTVTSSVAFFSPELMTWDTPKAVYWVTAILWASFGSVFLWQNRKALPAVIAASTLALLFALPVPAQAATTCEPGGELRRAQNFVFYAAEVGTILNGLQLGKTMALGVVSATYAYNELGTEGILSDWGTRLCDGILEGELNNIEVQQMEREAMIALWDALAESLDDLTAEITDSISKSWAIPVYRYNYDPRYNNLGYGGHLDRGAFFSFGGGYVMINNVYQVCFGTDTGVACYR